VTKLRALLDRDPDDPTSWFTLGRALLELSRWREAIDAFGHALARNPRYTAAHRDLGRALLEAGEVAEAARVLRGALPARAGERRPADRSRDGDVPARGREDPGRARDPRTTRSQHAAAPSAPRAENAEAKALYRRGFEHFANDRHDEAIALYEQALRLDPALAIAWNGLSLAHRQKGDLEAAIEAGRRLIELEPDDALSHTNLSILYQRRGMIPRPKRKRRSPCRSR
jgi:tetratricopeptide (TPR) repeat protein